MACLIPNFSPPNFRDRDGYTYIWKIPYSPESKIISAVTPPVCMIPGTSWSLRLFVQDELISLNLIRSDLGPRLIEIDFELSFLTLCNFPERVRVHMNYPFLKNTEYKYFGSFVLNDYIVNNRLTVRCRVWHPTIEMKPAYCFFSSVLVKERTTYDWCIKAYSKLQQFPIYRSHLPVLNILPVTVEFLTDEPGTIDVSHVRIAFGKIDVEKLGRLVFTISLLTVQKELKHRIRDDCPLQLWYINDFEWDIPYEILKEEMMCRKKLFLPKDVLTVRLEFEFWLTRPDSSDVSEYKMFQNKFEHPNSSDENTSSSPILDSRRYDNSEFQDSALGHGDSAVGNSANSQKDSIVGDSTQIHKDSTLGQGYSATRDSTLVSKNSSVGDSTVVSEDTSVGDSTLVSKNSSVSEDSSVGDSSVGDSTLVSEDSSVGDSTLVSKDSSVGDSTLRQGDTVQSLRLLRKRKISG